MAVDFSRPEYMDADREAAGRRHLMAKEQRLIRSEESINQHLKDGWRFVTGGLAMAVSACGRHPRYAAVLERDVPDGKPQEPQEPPK